MAHQNEVTSVTRTAGGATSGAAWYVGRVGALAVALGIGAALACGGAIAKADAPDAGSAKTADGGATSPAEAKVGKPQKLHPRLPKNSDSGNDSDSGAQADQQARDDAPVRGRHNRTAADTRSRALARSAAPVQSKISETKPVSEIKPVSAAKLIEAQSVRPTANASTPHVTADLHVTAPPQIVSAALHVSAPTATLGAIRLVAPLNSGTGDAPIAPVSTLMGALQLVSREREITSRSGTSGAMTSSVAQRSLVTSAAATPSPSDTASTPYGNIGKWMLTSNGQVSNYGGAKYNGQALYEPVNVIIIDPNATTPAQATKDLNAALSKAGFPASAPHTTGYKALINGVVYGQQPTGFLQAFTDSQGNHGRIFGAAPAVSGQGYVWTGAFSTEGPTHGYVSFDGARDELAEQLVASGAATRLDDVDMGNAGITGDHDGKAVVLVLNPIPNTPPTATVTQNKPDAWTGAVTGKVTATDSDGDKLTYAGTSTSKGTVTVTSTGSFTYTPTAAARHAAAASAASATDKTDTFTITVSDGAGGVTAVPVTVTVLPKNSAPTSKATVNKADPVSGTVTGSIAVSDADRDGVIYTATNPTLGSVTINPDGTFTYNPTVAARQQARATTTIDTDTFSVTVDDGHGGVNTVSVTTTIAPSDRAPVPGALSVGTPAAFNGAVKGSLAASDPDGDKITFSAGSMTTSKGMVWVSSTGAFTYTPTAAARSAAASDTATAADKMDTFTMVVTDQYGAASTVPVTVPILGR